jgi:capsid protein
MTNLLEKKVDRAVSAFSPRAGIRRRVERRFAELWPGEAYRAASHRDRMVRHWNPLAALNPDKELLPERLELVARCRDEYRNNPIARSAVNTPVISIVGCGLAMQCRIDRAFLGISDDESSAWESKTERLFASWASHTDCVTMSASANTAYRRVIVRFVCPSICWSA